MGRGVRGPRRGGDGRGGFVAGEKSAGGRRGL